MNEVDECLQVSLEEKEEVCRQSSHLFQHFSHFIDVIIILGILDKMSYHLRLLGWYTWVNF